MFLVFISVTFLALDFFYFIWILQIKDKFERKISISLMQALFGFGKKMKEYLGQNIGLFT